MSRRTLAITFAILICLPVLGNAMSAHAHLGALPDPANEGTFICRDHGQLLPHCTISGDCTFDDFIGLFVNAAIFGLGIAVVLALYFLLIGLFDLVTSGGNTEKIQSGKKALVNAIYGLVIIASAWIVVNTVYVALTGTTDVAVPGGAPDITSDRAWWALKSDEDRHTYVGVPCNDQDHAGFCGGYQLDRGEQLAPGAVSCTPGGRYP